MYELLILGKLARGPMHGYGIAKVVEHITGPFRKVQWGALYPLLARLEREGLICAETGAVEGRERKVYDITPSGRLRLHELLLDTERHLGEYDVCFAQKVALFGLLAPDERLHLARHYAVHARQNMEHLQRKRQELMDMASSPCPQEGIDHILNVVDHRTEYWRSELAWAERLIADQQMQREREEVHSGSD